jgi:hypothetical protein
MEEANRSGDRLQSLRQPARAADIELVSHPLTPQPQSRRVGQGYASAEAELPGLHARGGAGDVQIGFGRVRSARDHVDAAARSARLGETEERQREQGEGEEP